MITSDSDVTQKHDHFLTKPDTNLVGLHLA